MGIFRKQKEGNKSVLVAGQSPSSVSTDESTTPATTVNVIKQQQNKHHRKPSFKGMLFGKKKNNKSSKNTTNTQLALHERIVTTVQQQGEVEEQQLCINDGDNDKANLNNITVDSIESILMDDDNENEVSKDQTLQKSIDVSKDELDGILKDIDFVEIDGTEGTELILPGYSVMDDSNYTNEQVVDDDQEEELEEKLDESSINPPNARIIIQQQQHNEAIEKAEEPTEKKDAPSTLPATIDREVSANYTKDVETLDETKQKDNSLLVEEDDDITENKLQKDTTTNEGDTTQDRIKVVTGVIMNAMNCTAQDAENCATLPGKFGGIVAMPATACQPIINQQVSKSSRHKNLERTEKLDDQFAKRFLHSMLNIGVTLVYQRPVDDGEDWIGRTVNMNFCPGICSARQFSSPSIQWTIMAGGKVKEDEVKKIGLLDIAAVTLNNIVIDSNDSGDADNSHDVGSCSDNSQYEDELDCFFSITSKDGDVHLFEALNSDESHRVITGIKNLAFRLTSHLIAGDSKVVADFFDNSQEPTEAQIGMKEAMMRISNAFLDDGL